MKYGLTKGEEFLRRHTIEYIPTEAPHDDSKFGGVVLLAIMLGLLLINAFLLPLADVHADAPQLSDREQEALYCEAWLNGSEVTGGTESEITKHCARFN